jgi:hypothetical protein
VVIIKKFIAVIFALISAVVISTTSFAADEQVTVDPEAWSGFVNAQGYQYVKYDDARKWLADYLGTSVNYVKTNYSIAWLEGSQVLIIGDCQQDLDGVEWIYQMYYDKSLNFCVKRAGSNGFIEVLAGSDYASLAEVLGDMKKVSSGVFDLGMLAFAFILGNALCFLLLGGSLCFTALVLVKRSMKYSKR